MTTGASGSQEAEPAASTARAVPPREVAWRLFAHELTSSSVQEKGEGEKAATHVLSPLGARVGRVLMVGTFTQIEPLGEGTVPMWRSRLTDPTGGVSVTAGPYQPRAAAFLSQARAPCRALLVGKPHLFLGREGVPLVSIRAELLVSTSAQEESDWVRETAGHTLRRIELCQEVLGADGAEVGPSLKGCPARWAGDARSVLRHYPGADPGRFVTTARSALAKVTATADAPAGLTGNGEVPLPSES
ncbi:MAG: hypothetical protein KGJ23_04660 [Euryarchaeota archaeon]|nr:hypothetical protein [Euryarchaeota archaeon]MDE1835890.1 hypothetical protein [Euryarchaeota archaeon]MDE1880235.1 hypothetical protein [Euryarchaeota archaeon]MDE2044432.1 hypothetical protein [Thermoplasmata archaeon]